MNDTFFARTDSNSANNPALNLTGDAAVQIVFVPDPSSGSGDLILESGTGPDPDTLVEIGGQTYQFSFELSGTLPTQNKNGAQQVPDQFEGDPIYIVVVYDYPSVGETTRLAFLPDSNATQAEMDAFGTGAVAIQGVDTSPPPAAVCFSEGTAILTPTGERPVETLAVGDFVSVIGGAPMSVRWIYHSRYDWPGSSPAFARSVYHKGPLAMVVPTGRSSSRRSTGSF